MEVKLFCACLHDRKAILSWSSSQQEKAFYVFQKEKNHTKCVDEFTVWWDFNNFNLRQMHPQKIDTMKEKTVWDFSVWQHNHNLSSWYTVMLMVLNKVYILFSSLYVFTVSSGQANGSNKTWAKSNRWEKCNVSSCIFQSPSFFVAFTFPKIQTHNETASKSLG